MCETTCNSDGYLKSNSCLKVLCVGNCILYNICDVKSFPSEDLGFRCLEQKWTRGGNASNNCTVLRQLGVSCEFLGTLAKNPITRFLTEDLEKQDINIDHCVYIDGADCPCSIAIVNSENGSRTILHANKNLPEITFQQFKNAVDLGQGKYNWIHFEGRYLPTETKQMLKYIEDFNNSISDCSQRIITSVELEKCRQELGELIDCANYVFISKDYAKLCGFNTKQETVEKLSSSLRDGSTVICAWGEDGAAAKTTGKESVVAHAYPPDTVIDTLGAGDTFVAATISALNRGDSVRCAIDFGCQIAGAKVGMRGFEGLCNVNTTKCE